MNKSETAKVLGYIKAAYINSFAKYTEQEREAMIIVWQNAFKNETIEEVYRAAVKWCNTEKYAPSIYDIKKTIFELSGIKQISAGEAWDIVHKNCSSTHTYAKDNFSKLPLNIKTAVGSSSFLQELGSASDSQAGFLRKEFEKKYTAILEDEQKKLYNGELSYSQIEYNNYLSIGTPKAIEVK